MTFDNLLGIKKTRNKLNKKIGFILALLGNEENIKPQSSAGGKNCSTPSNQRTQNPRKSMLRGLSVLSPIEDEGSSFESSSHKSSMSSCNMSDQSANCTDYSAK